MRKSLLLTLLVTALAATGCRMCSNCFDYAGPVHEPGYVNDGTYGRAGSAFGGRAMPMGGEVIFGDKMIVGEEVILSDEANE